MPVEAPQQQVKFIRIDSKYLDAGNVKSFRDQLATIDAGQTRVAIDFRTVEFVDSSGLGAILSCLRTLNAQGGELKVFNLLPSVQSLLELVRMHKVIEICGNKEDVLAAFARAGNDPASLS